MVIFLIVMLCVHAAGLLTSVATVSKTGPAGTVAAALQMIIIVWAALLLRAAL